MLRIQNDTMVSYLRFDVPTPPAGEAITEATLRVYAMSGSRCALGAEVFQAASNDWKEKAVRWHNQPGTTGSALALATWVDEGYLSFDVTPAVLGPGLVSFVLRHAGACEAPEEDVFVSREADDNQPELFVTTDVVAPPPACSDGIDNDSDGFADFPDDPGCVDSADSDETDPASTTTAPPPPPTTTAPPPPACSDGIDNDSDGLTDFPDDPGCVDSTDLDEADPTSTTTAPPPPPTTTAPPPPPPPTTTAPPPPTGDAFEVAAAGDIVCDPAGSRFDGSDPAVCQHRATADLLADMDAVFPLGDLQYPDGTLEQFQQGYDSSWGLYSGRTYPVPGNHEYHVDNAQGYFDYWKSVTRSTGTDGYYSFDLGSWHAVALNSSSTCSVGPACDEGSPQNDFLEQDLAATTRDCIIAYWHAPLFNSGDVHSGSDSVRPLWEDLYAAGADIVLNGHEHSYQRFAKQSPNGTAAADGIREFVVGTGGSRLYALAATPAPNLEAGVADSFGVLHLTLGVGSYSWEFVDVDGQVLDSGGPVACN